MSIVGSQLSKDEQEVLKELVEHDKPMLIEKIQHPNKVDVVSRLLRRGLIEKSSDGLVPIPVVEEYIRNSVAD